MLGIIDQPEMADEPCDHEHLDEYAEGKNGNFRYVPNASPPLPPCITYTCSNASRSQGCPGIETRVPLLFNYGLMTGRISPEKFVQLTSTNAAKLYGCYPKVCANPLR